VNGFRKENLEALAFNDQCIDVVVTLDVGEHVTEPELVFKEVTRVLKDGGLCLHKGDVQQSDTWDHWRVYGGIRLLQAQATYVGTNGLKQCHANH